MSDSKKALERTKLSKSFFMHLQEGLFIVSNCTDEHARPIFAEEVWPLEIRELQWQVIVERHANHRLCEIFQSRADYDEVYFNRILKLRMGEAIDI